MKEVYLKRNCDAQQGTKRLAILQKNEEKDCKTKVYKSFRYHISKAEALDHSLLTPEIFITKNFDTKRGIERFTFTVHGAFYLDYKQELLKVDFLHTLKIEIRWKSKVFSPKKSEILT